MRELCKPLYKTPRGMDQSVMMHLISCDWVRRRCNVIVTGPTGSGKTFIACALANKACREGYRSLYIRAPKFTCQMALERGDGSYGKTINKLARTPVLVIDDLARAPMTDSERRDLLEVVEERHGGMLPLSSPVSSPLNTGTSKSAIPPSPTLYSTGWSTTPTKYIFLCKGNL